MLVLVTGEEKRGMSPSVSIFTEKYVRCSVRLNFIYSKLLKNKMT